jgi:hypothetical protein
VGAFLAIDAIHDATAPPPVYDYGVNVVYQGDEVYVDGKPAATATQYSQQAIVLANEPASQPPPPMPAASGQQAEWLPMGVWALAQEEKGDAYMFLQISVDKEGVLSGAYKNVLSGEQAPISGQVDKKKQRVAWKIGSNNTVIETVLQNLTQEVASSGTFWSGHNPDLVASASETAADAECTANRNHGHQADRIMNWGTPYPRSAQQRE